MELILASASPRRSELMAQVGWKFRIKATDVAEEISSVLPVAEAVAELALRKARACCVESGLIIGADTVVVLGDQIMGKPGSAVEAREMLATLSGKCHRVITGVAVLNAATGDSWAEAEETMVRFRSLTGEEIEGYVKCGEPLDKAGAYGIQGKGALLVEGIEGCYFNVMGLPLNRLARMLFEAGFEGAYGF